MKAVEDGFPTPDSAEEAVIRAEFDAIFAIA